MCVINGKLFFSTSRMGGIQSFSVTPSLKYITTWWFLVSQTFHCQNLALLYLYLHYNKPKSEHQFLRLLDMTNHHICGMAGILVTKGTALDRRRSTFRPRGRIRGRRGLPQNMCIFLQVRETIIAPCKVARSKAYKFRCRTSEKQNKS